MLKQLHGANLTLDSDEDQDTFGKVTKHNTHDSEEVSFFPTDGYKEQTRHYNAHQHEALLTKTIHKRSTDLERWFHGANLTVNSEVGQDA